MNKKVETVLVVLMAILAIGLMLITCVLIGTYGFEAAFKGAIDYFSDPFAHGLAIAGAWISLGIGIVFAGLAIDWNEVPYEEEA